MMSGSHANRHEQRSRRSHRSAAGRHAEGAPEAPRAGLSGRRDAGGVGRRRLGARERADASKRMPPTARDARRCSRRWSGRCRRAGGRSRRGAAVRSAGSSPMTAAAAALVDLVCRPATPRAGSGVARARKWRRAIIRPAARPAASRRRAARPRRPRPSGAHASRSQRKAPAREADARATPSTLRDTRGGAARKRDIAAAGANALAAPTAPRAPACRRRRRRRPCRSPRRPPRCVGGAARRERAHRRARRVRERAGGRDRVVEPGDAVPAAARRRACSGRPMPARPGAPKRPARRDTLTAGSSPSPSVCWLVGRSGTVLLSTDGRILAPARVSRGRWICAAVTATDTETATVTTADGRAFVTADGGRTWSRTPGF